MTTALPLLKSLAKLPAPELWPVVFKGSKARGQMRVSVMTESLADQAAKIMQIESHPNRSIIELYPGPGQLTRSMVLAGAKNVVTVENGQSFQSSLNSLIESSKGRIRNFAINPASEPFEEVLSPKNNALPGVEPQPWDKVHSDLILVGSLPSSSTGEKAIMDLLTSSIDKMGVFRMGRVEMFLFCSKESVQRVLAKPGTASRSRTSILAEAAAEITPILRPGAQNFYLPCDHQMLRVVPHATPKLETSLEVLDFCLRTLFTSKSQSLNKVIKLLGPGADILLGRLSFDHSIKIKHMSIEQLNEVALKFDQWPLRPTVLHDDMFMHEDKRKR